LPVSSAGCSTGKKRFSLAPPPLHQWAAMSSEFALGFSFPLPPHPPSFSPRGCFPTIAFTSVPSPDALTSPACPIDPSFEIFFLAFFFRTLSWAGAQLAPAKLPPHFCGKGGMRSGSPKLQRTLLDKLGNAHVFDFLWQPT